MKRVGAKTEMFARIDKVEIILVDLDRANMRATAADRDVVVLQKQLAQELGRKFASE